MSEQERETDFLKEMLKWGPRSEIAGLQQGLYNAEREEKCVRGALKRVVQLTAVAGMGFLATGYSLPHVPVEYLDPLARIFFILLVTAGLSTLLFAWVWGRARFHLTEAREKCRLFIKSQMEGMTLPNVARMGEHSGVQVTLSVEERAGGNEGESDTKYLPFPAITNDTALMRRKGVLQGVSRARAS